MCHSVLQCHAVCSRLRVMVVVRCVDAACYSVLQCIAVFCSVLQCVAVCYSVLQCVARKGNVSDFTIIAVTYVCAKGVCVCTFFIYLCVHIYTYISIYIYVYEYR